MALVCPRYLVEGKMSVVGRACLRYTLKAFFREADTFSTFMSWLYSERTINFTSNVRFCISLLQCIYKEVILCSSK